VRFDLRRSFEGPEELWRVRNDLHEHDGGLQPGRVRGGLLDGAHELQQFLRRHQERSPELRSVRNDLHRWRGVHLGQMRMRGRRADMQRRLYEHDRRSPQLRRVRDQVRDQ
jgi:hypothetical protein